MTQTHDDALTDYEADFASPLALDPQAQDLLFREARTANTFSDEPVSDEQVQAIYDLVKWAPTSMNNQPLRIVLVRSPQARARLVESMADGNKPKTGRPRSWRSSRRTSTSTTSSAAVPALPRRPRPLRRQRGGPRVGGEAQRRAADRLLHPGVRAAGLAAGPMTGLDTASVDRAFFPDGRHRTMVVMNIGEPGDDPWFDRLPRLDYDEVVTSV